MSCYITDYRTSSPPEKSVALEDCIMHKSHPVTAGSRMLQNFIAPFNATVVTRLESSGYTITGKTAMDEFGVSILPENDNGGIAGAVAAVKSGGADFALCNDISGKLRRHSVQNGLFCIRPTYGTVSRFGLIPTISSMDQIGIVCKNPADGFELLSNLAGNDPNDGAMYPACHYKYVPTDGKITLALPENVLETASGSDRLAIGKLSEKFGSVNINLKYYDLYNQVMCILGSAEISNNISRYDGVKFGYRASDIKNLNDMYTKTRSEAFGADIKLMAILGSMVLSQDCYTPYYEKAMKIRRLIKESLDFDRYDAIVLPVKAESDRSEQTSLYALAMLAGLPSLSMPYGETGVQLIARAGNENALFTAWEVVSNEL